MYPGVKFDVYHMGMPYARQAAFLGKNYRNVYLNLCWSPIVSEEMFSNAISEWIDLVPVNKIFGFGGDFIYLPENIYTHLKLTKKLLSDIFAKKIYKGQISYEDTIFIIKRWMYHNPKEVYGLN